MILRQVLQGVVIVVAPQTHGRQDQDLPVGQPGAAARGPGVVIDVPLDELQELLTHLGTAVEVLQGGKDRD
jgi:hypothetical protein